jgi:hypothetical protein
LSVNYCRHRRIAEEDNKNRDVVIKISLAVWGGRGLLEDYIT